MDIDDDSAVVLDNDDGFDIDEVKYEDDATAPVVINRSEWDHIELIAVNLCPIYNSIHIFFSNKINQVAPKYDIFGALIQVQIKEEIFTVFHDSMSDGNCGWDCIARAMYGDPRYFHGSINRRHKIIMFLRNCVYMIMRYCVDEEFIQSYYRWDQRTFVDYLEDNNKANAWIDHEQFKGLCKLFHNKIILIYKKHQIGVFQPSIICNKGVNVTPATDINQFIPLLLEGDEHNGHYKPMICNKLLKQDVTYPGILSSQIRVGATEGEFFRSHYLKQGESKDRNKTYYEFWRMQNKYETIINFEQKLIADDQKEEQNYIGDKKDQSDKEDTKFQSLDAALTESHGSKTEITIYHPLFIPADQKYIDVIIPLIDSPYYRPKYNYHLCVALKIRIDVPKNLIEKSISTKLSEYYDKNIDYKIKDTFWNKNLFRSNQQIPKSEYVGKQYQIDDKYNNINPDSLTFRQKLAHRLGLKIILTKGYIKLEQELDHIIDDNSNLPLTQYTVHVSSKNKKINKYTPTTKELLDSFFIYFSEPSKKQQFNQLLQNRKYKLRNLLQFETWMKVGVYITFRHYYSWSSKKSGSRKNFKKTIEHLKYKLDPDFFMIKSVKYLMDYVRCYQYHRDSFPGLMSKKDASQMNVMTSQIIQDAKQRFGYAKLNESGGMNHYFKAYFEDIFGAYYMAMEDCYYNAFKSSQCDLNVLVEQPMEALEVKKMEMPKLIPDKDDGGDVARKYMKEKDKEIIIEINDDDMIDID